MQECSHALPGPAPSSTLRTWAADAGMRVPRATVNPPLSTASPAIVRPRLKAALLGDVMPCMQTKPGHKWHLETVPWLQRAGCLTPAKAALLRSAPSLPHFTCSPTRQRQPWQKRGRSSAVVRTQVLLAVCQPTLLTHVSPPEPLGHGQEALFWNISLSRCLRMGLKRVLHSEKGELSSQICIPAVDSAESLPTVFNNSANSIALYPQEASHWLEV